MVPWLRLWSPSGVRVGDTTGASVATLDLAAAETGTYTVLVVTFDAGYDGTGTYRLEMTRTPGPYTLSAGDQGGALTNGSIHTGEIVQGDVDAWTFTATAGQRIDLHLAEVVDNNGMVPWLRLWSPSGVRVGDTTGAAAANLEVLAAETGTYTVLVATFDAGYDGTGTYRLEMAATPGPVTVSGGDQGGGLTNGAVHAGTNALSDVDSWTISAVAGQHITVTVTETLDNNGFVPWIRLWAPNGARIGDTTGASSATISSALAPATGTYLVLVGSFDAGYDATGNYNLQVTVGP